MATQASILGWDLQIPLPPRPLIRHTGEVWRGATPSPNAVNKLSCTLVKLTQERWGLGETCSVFDQGLQPAHPFS